MSAGSWWRNDRSKDAQSTMRMTGVSGGLAAATVVLPVRKFNKLGGAR